MVASAYFPCPGCERTNFGSLAEVKNHFIQKSHPLFCPICRKVFKDALAVIQHYQKSKCAPKNTSIITQYVPRPSLPPKDVRRTSPEKALQPYEHRMSISDDHGSSSFSPSETPNAFQESRIPCAWSVDISLACPMLTFNATEALPGVEFGVPGYITVLNPLEQSLILRYLRSRCHSWSRLQTEKYIIGPGSIRNKQRPSKGSIPTYEFRETPPLDRQTGGSCQAIAIDCEMVGVRHGRQALAFLSAIDVLTGRLLISRYVVPSEEVVDWRSKISGITEDIMTSAVCSGAAFNNWREARDKLWELMDESTILVGQSLNFDLEVLGICHAKIVDTAILTAETVFPSIISTEPLPRMWSLKSLARDFLSLEIQNSTLGHNAVEDAYAARDIAIWCIRNPEELRLWAESARRQEEERKRRKDLQRHRKGKSKQNLPASRTTRVWRYDAQYDDDFDDFRLSDLAEELGWPEGYDPWSD